MKKQAFILALLLSFQSAWADPILSFRVSDDPKLHLEGKTVYKSGKVTLADGRVCERCKVGSIGSFVTSIVDNDGNNWPLTAGLVKVDIHPIMSAYKDSINQSQTLRTQTDFSIHLNPAGQ